MDIKNIPAFAEKIKQGDPTALAQAITLVESQRPDHWELAKKLIKTIYKPECKSFRLGISGPPGVGKSSFIEKVGLELTKQGQRVAVLAIDPSSPVSGGSILGDKTRMEELSRSPLAFLRPSPSRGHLGGVTSSMPATLILCEMAGFDWILVESVGVGQSEVELKHMVDYFVLLAQPGAGDELQGIKKGILEYVDQIVVNKSDLDPQIVSTTRQQYLAALKIMRGRDIPVMACSCLKNDGIYEVFEHFKKVAQECKRKDRSEQLTMWTRSLLVSQFQAQLKQNKQWAHELSQLEQQVSQGKLLPFEAVDQFFNKI